MHRLKHPYSSSSLATIHSIFPEAHCIELCTSYRSTTEITQFAQEISHNDKLVPIERHGPEPEILACADRADETARIVALVLRLVRGDHASVGVVCRTVARAQAIHEALVDAEVEATMLDYTA